ncbi:MAG: excisionase family DNA-binding protein [Rhodospirillales bacterium]|nr:excisionase family DNA-binding protein [Rhodospirillales bacterium]
MSVALDATLARAVVQAIRDDPSLRAELRALLGVDERDRRRDGPTWLSVDEAARYVGASRRTVERLIASGRLRSTTLGRRRLVRRVDLDALAAAGEEAVPAAPSRRRAGVG